MKSRRSSFLLAFVLSLLSACSHIPRATDGVRVRDIWTGISTKNFIRVRGVGVVPPGAKTQTERRGRSRQAALVAARYELLAVIKGVKISGGVSVSQLGERDSLIKALANAMVRGGEEVLTEWLPDDSAVVTLELKRSTVEQIIQEKTPREVELEKRIARDVKEIRAKEAEIARLDSLIAAGLSPGKLKSEYFMPKTTEFFGGCKLDFTTEPGWNCATQFLAYEWVTLGTYPLGVDLVALPFRLMAWPFKRHRQKREEAILQAYHLDKFHRHQEARLQAYYADRYMPQ